MSTLPNVRRMVTPLLTIFCLVLALFAAPAVFAAESKAEKTASVPDKPTASPDRSTPVAVEFEGTDSIGSRLATRVRELFNASNLFSLTEKDTPKIRLLITTKPEFESRPAVGSVYCVVWVFSQSESILRHFLVRDVGVLSPNEVDDVAAKLVERTDGLAVRYGYLFQ